MLLTVNELKYQVEGDLPGLVERLQHLTGRRGEEEAMAWQASLPKLTEALSAPAFGEMHVYFAGAGSVALEYQLPAASAWCDVVLLGQQDGKPTAVVIELKDWRTWGDRPGPSEGLMVRHGTIVLHPSDQVRGYVGYCQRFHSAVQHNAADVSGCVLFTRDHFTDSYSQPPNDRLAVDYPCFSTAPRAVREAFPGYLTSHLTTPHAEFAKAFVEGTYRQ